MTKEVKKDVNACEDYFTLVVESYIISAAMTLFHMNKLDDNPHEDIVQHDVWTHDTSERQSTLDHLCQLIIDKYL